MDNEILKQILDKLKELKESNTRIERKQELQYDVVNKQLKNISDYMNSLHRDINYNNSKVNELDRDIKEIKTTLYNQ